MRQLSTLRRLLTAGILLLLTLSCGNYRDARDTDPEDVVKVMTYNIRFDNPQDGSDRWNNRQDFLINQIRFQRPDILGTQEVLNGQLRDLRRGLRGYDYVGIGREGGNDGEFSAIFYNANTLQVEESNTFWLSPIPDRVSTGWDAALPRIVTWARFRHRASRQNFLVFNTHFDHRGEQARLESARQLVNTIDRLNTGNLPVIVTGDLNLTPETEPIRILTERLSDAYRAAPFRLGPEGTFNNFDYNTRADQRIDYIMTSPGVKVLSYATLTDAVNRRFPSDHFPVVAELVLE